MNNEKEQDKTVFGGACGYYKGYVAFFRVDLDANAILGRVINTEQNISFRVDEMSKLDQAFRDAIDTYLSVCNEEGIKPEAPEDFFCQMKGKRLRELNNKLSIAFLEKSLVHNQKILVDIRTILENEEKDVLFKIYREVMKGMVV